MINSTALNVSHYFISLASKLDENDLTNLKLQKLLYFAQGFYLAKNGKSLFQEPIEAWDFGPVVRTVYDKFKMCGAFPITVFDLPIADPESLSSSEKAIVQKVWNEFGKFSANYLVMQTHKVGSPWQITYVKGESNVIPTDLLKEYFTEV